MTTPITNTFIDDQNKNYSIITFFLILALPTLLMSGLVGFLYLVNYVFELNLNLSFKHIAFIGSLTSVLTTIIWMAHFIRTGICTIHEGCDAPYKIWGERKGKLKAGTFFHFPYFKVVIIQRMNIKDITFMVILEDEKDGGEFGKMEFEKTSSAVKIIFTVQTIDSIAALDKVVDVYDAMKKEIYGALSIFFGQYQLDYLNSNKAKIKPWHMLSKENFDDPSDPTNKHIPILDEAQAKANLEACSVYKTLLHWGLKMKFITFDIITSKELDEIRMLKFKAENEQEAEKIKAETAKIIAEGKKQARIKESEAEKQAMINVSEGRELDIINMKRHGVEASRTMRHLERDKLYENIGDKAVILNGNSNGNVGTGIDLGIGASIGNNSVKR